MSIFIFSNCKAQIKTEDKLNHQETKKYSGFARAYFASGCFWCVESVFQSVDGVTEVISGYSGGEQADPSYYSVSKGLTNHAEAVEVYYDPKKITYQTLVEVFFSSHDPTQINGQGPDMGRQYRSIAFYQNEKEKEIIKNYIKNLEDKKAYPAPIVTQVIPFRKFWKAEEYHQDYERKNPDNPYIKNVSIPRLKKFQKLFGKISKKDKN